MTLRRISNFVDPVDKATAARLTQQIGALEENVASFGIELLAESRLSLAGTGLVDTKLTLKPGQLAGFNTALTADLKVAIAAPRPGDAGKFLAVIKEEAVNQLTLSPPSGVRISGQATYPIVALGLVLLLCDGNNYWVV